MATEVQGKTLRNGEAAPKGTSVNKMIDACDPCSALLTEIGHTYLLAL